MSKFMVYELNLNRILILKRRRERKSCPRDSDVWIGLRAWLLGVWSMDQEHQRHPEAGWMDAKSQTSWIGVSILLKWGVRARLDAWSWKTRLVCEQKVKGKGVRSQRQVCAGSNGLLSWVLMGRARLSNDTVCLCCDPSLLVFFSMIPYIVVAHCEEGVGGPVQEMQGSVWLCSWATEGQVSDLDRSRSALLNIPKGQG